MSEQGDFTGTERDETDATVEYAKPSAIDVIEVEHLSKSTDTERIIVKNTDQQRPLAISGWQLDTDVLERRCIITSKTILEPGEVHTFEFDETTAALDYLNGGMITIWDSTGKNVYQGTYPASSESGIDN